MLIFCDTEFTNFTNPELLSVGLSFKDINFYGEITDKAILARCSNFSYDTVLTQFGKIPGAASTQKEMYWRITEFLSELSKENPGKKIKLLFDCDVDGVLIQKAIQNSDHLEFDMVLSKLILADVSHIFIEDAAKEFIEKYFNEKLLDPMHQHHALCDAQALKDTYNFTVSNNDLYDTRKHDFGLNHNVIASRRKVRSVLDLG